jgi:hypothetical protein
MRPAPGFSCEKGSVSLLAIALSAVIVGAGFAPISVALQISLRWRPAKVLETRAPQQ